MQAVGIVLYSIHYVAKIQEVRANPKTKGLGPCGIDEHTSKPKRKTNCNSVAMQNT